MKKNKYQAAFSLTGGIDIGIEMKPSLCQALMAVKPKRDMRLSIIMNRSEHISARDVTIRFSRVCCEIASLATRELLDTDCPYENLLKEVQADFVNLCAGFIVRETFDKGVYKKLFGSVPNDDDSDLIKMWLTSKKGVYGHIDEAKYSNPFHKHSLWLMMEVVENCYLPDLHNRVAGVQKYLELISYRGYDSRITVAESVLLECFADLFSEFAW